MFVEENQDKVCDRLRLINQEKQGGNDTIRFNDENVAISDKSIEWKNITTTQHKKLLISFVLV